MMEAQKNQTVCFKEGVQMKTLLIAVLSISTAFAAPATKEAATTYNVDTEGTKIEWIGKKVAGPHSGTVIVPFLTFTVPL